MGERLLAVEGACSAGLPLEYRLEHWAQLINVQDYKTFINNTENDLSEVCAWYSLNGFCSLNSGFCSLNTGFCWKVLLTFVVNPTADQTVIYTLNTYIWYANCCQKFHPGFKALFIGSYPFYLSLFLVICMQVILHTHSPTNSPGYLLSSRHRFTQWKHRLVGIIGLN